MHCKNHKRDTLLSYTLTKEFSVVIIVHLGHIVGQTIFTRCHYALLGVDVGHAITLRHGEVRRW